MFLLGSIVLYGSSADNQICCCVQVTDHSDAVHLVLQDSEICHRYDFGSMIVCRVSS